jgi:hypothetical protein
MMRAECNGAGVTPSDAERARMEVSGSTRKSRTRADFVVDRDWHCLWAPRSKVTLARGRRAQRKSGHGLPKRHVSR